MHLIDGPRGPTCVLEDGESTREFAAKHAAYMKGLFCTEVTIETNADGSITVLTPGQEAVTFAYPNQLQRASKPTPRPCPPHEALHRQVRARRG